MRVASAEFSRLAHPQTPVALKIKALLQNIYLAHCGGAGINSALGSPSQQAVLRRSLQPHINNCANVVNAQRRFAQRMETMQRLDGNVNCQNWQPESEIGIVREPEPVRELCAPSVTNHVLSASANAGAGVANEAATQLRRLSVASSADDSATLLRRQASMPTTQPMRRMSITPLVARALSGVAGAPPTAATTPTADAHTGRRMSVDPFSEWPADAALAPLPFNGAGAAVPVARAGLGRRMSFAQSMLAMTIDERAVGECNGGSSAGTERNPITRSRSAVPQSESVHLVAEVERAWSGSLRSVSRTETVAASAGIVLERKQTLQRRASVSFAAPAGIRHDALAAVAAASHEAISTSVAAAHAAAVAMAGEEGASNSSPLTARRPSLSPASASSPPATVLLRRARSASLSLGRSPTSATRATWLSPTGPSASPPPLSSSPPPLTVRVASQHGIQGILASVGALVAAVKPALPPLPPLPSLPPLPPPLSSHV